MPSKLSTERYVTFCFSKISSRLSLKFACQIPSYCLNQIIPIYVLQNEAIRRSLHF